MNKEHGLVRNIVLWLHRRHEKWQREQAGPAGKFYERVIVRCPPVSEPELERFLREPAQDTPSIYGKYLVLEPIPQDGGIVPVLCLQYDFRRRNRELRLQVGLFLFRNADLITLGVRFEPSEGPGMHDYSHAQFCTALRGSGAPALPQCPLWLPTSQPAFFIKADDPVTLLIATLISLYGAACIQELKSQNFYDLKASLARLSDNGNQLRLA